MSQSQNDNNTKTYKKTSLSAIERMLDELEERKLLILKAKRTKERENAARQRKARVSACIKKGSIFDKADLIDVPDAVILGLLLSTKQELLDTESKYYQSWYKLGNDIYNKNKKNPHSAEQPSSENVASALTGEEDV